jgi:hypothetical protein
LRRDTFETYLFDLLAERRRDNNGMYPLWSVATEARDISVVPQTECVTGPTALTRHCFAAIESGL